MMDVDEERLGKLRAMVGRTPVAIEQDEYELTFRFSDGSEAKFWHDQDCCECVVIEEVAGDWQDLIGHPLLVADERTTETRDSERTEEMAELGLDPRDDADEWTFYTFRSIGGTVDVRWHGSSNGYYSTSVDFCFTEATP